MTDHIAEDRWVIVEDCVRTPPAFRTKDWAYIDKDPELFTEDWCKLYKILKNVSFSRHSMKSTPLMRNPFNNCTRIVHSKSMSFTRKTS